MDGLLEIFGRCPQNVYELLRVSIYQWKPRALYLHHRTMTAAEHMENIRDGEFDLRDFARLEWFGFLEAVAKSSAKNIAAHKLLIATHRNVSGIWIRVGKVARV